MSLDRITMHLVRREKRANGKRLKPAGGEPPAIAGILRERYGVSF